MKKYYLLPIALIVSLLALSQINTGKPALKKIAKVYESNSHIPIVFTKDYDISILGLENFHPFDSKKYGKVYKRLIKNGTISESSVFTPTAVTDEQLLQVHSQEYLNSLDKSATIARVAEMPPLKTVPNKTLHKALLKPMKLATGGTILGAELALDSGYAINLSGGYHHAKSGNGEGFCFFADINLAIKALQKRQPNIKVMIVDLDAHQGNGHEAISEDSENIIIFDMYNKDVYPNDTDVKKYIDYDIPLMSYTEDEEYLTLLEAHLEKAIEETQPDFIIYNAGTDIYENDPLGRLSVSKEGIIKRDEYVFRSAISGDIPILMVLSGGYTKESAQIIAESIENIVTKNKL